MCTHYFQGRKLGDVFVLPKWLQPNVIEKKNATNMKKITKGGREKEKKKKENKGKRSFG